MATTVVNAWIAGGGASGGGPFNETSLPFNNPVIPNISYLGDASEKEAELPIWETPFENDPKPYVYRLRYLVKAAAFQSLARWAAGPYGGNHVGESNFRTETGGRLTFYREFARKPDSRNEFESYTYAYQILSSASGIGTEVTSSASVTEIPITVTSRVQFDYFETDNPEQVQLDKAPKVIVLNGAPYFVNGWGSLIRGQQMLAEDAVLRVWKGKIYERVQRFIEARFLWEET